jgi:predicted TIM-barrel fold metal-dependent hydrolase
MGDDAAFYERGKAYSVQGETFLANARRQAEERGYSAFTIVDVDAHHFEDQSWGEIVPHIDPGPVRDWAELLTRRQGVALGGGPIPIQVGNQTAGGRVQLGPAPVDEGSHLHPEVQRLLFSMDMIGIDYSILFPTPLLTLGLQPSPDVEVQLSTAYTRWLIEDVLPGTDRVKLLVYLPFNDPDASLRVVREFGDLPNVHGFMVTSVRFAAAHSNVYAPLYAELQERRLPLAFHAAYNWTESSMALLDKFISVHALGFTFSNMVHLTNMVVNGIPERFPGLKLIWIESGLAWVPFLMQRLDNEYLKRTSEAPLLRRLPSEYMREMYYSTQPLERPVRPEQVKALEATFELMDGEHTLLYSSDYPHWDWDPPSAVYDLPFLSEEAKRKILGGNAMKLLRIERASSL